jgi:hypothetical protein
VARKQALRDWRRVGRIPVDQKNLFAHMKIRHRPSSPSERFEIVHISLQVPPGLCPAAHGPPSPLTPTSTRLLDGLFRNQHATVEHDLRELWAARPPSATTLTKELTLQLYLLGRQVAAIWLPWLHRRYSSQNFRLDNVVKIAVSICTCVTFGQLRITSNRFISHWNLTQAPSLPSCEAIGSCA